MSSASDNDHVSQIGLELPGQRLGVEQAYKNLVFHVKKAGGSVSEKIDRRALPPHHLASIVAIENIEAGEELISIPLRLAFSSESLQAALPEFYASVSSLPGFMHGVHALTEPAQVVSLALMLALHIHTGLEKSNLPISEETAAVWCAWAEVLLSEDFRSHPVFYSMTDPMLARQTLLPSTEFLYAEAMAQELIAAHRIVSEELGIMLGEAKSTFSLGVFMQACLSCQTRQFSRSFKTVMVPIADFFNHHAKYSCTWSWDADADVMRVTAACAHSVGDELCFSYGVQSNPMLFRTYAFTLSPELEPFWSFVVQGSKPCHVYKKYLSDACQDVVIRFESRELHDSLVRVCKDCIAKGLDIFDFLKELCSFYLSKYECDSSLGLALKALQRVRSMEPACSAWWAVPAFDADIPCWQKSCLRVKMSEYLCLAMYLEASKLAQGHMQKELCIEGASTICQWLEGIR